MINNKRDPNFFDFFARHIRGLKGTPYAVVRKSKHIRRIRFFKNQQIPWWFMSIIIFKIKVCFEDKGKLLVQWNYVESLRNDVTTFPKGWLYTHSSPTPQSTPSSWSTRTTPKNKWHSCIFWLPPCGLVPTKQTVNKWLATTLNFSNLKSLSPSTDFGTTEAFF